MIFVDEVKINCFAGKGGNGCVSFRREKYIPFGGPNGGDGGAGGSIILRASSQMNSLSHLRHTRQVRAENGHSGQGSQKTGRCGEDLIIDLPVGSCVFHASEADAPMIVDLSTLGQTYVIAPGGSGGIGNMRFKSSTNRAPRQFTSGHEGNEIGIRVELRVMADIGLLGLPNAGKSSLLRQVSAATPKVAGYAFTTTKPYVGVVSFNKFDSFVMADIPGLIEGAAEGHGMGDKFLKHLKRCRMLLHIVDLSLDSDVGEQVRVIQAELDSYGQGLSEKPCWLVLNKVDIILPQERQALLEGIRAVDTRPVFMISALTGEGCSDLMEAVGDALFQE